MGIGKLLLNVGGIILLFVMVFIGILLFGSGWCCAITTTYFTEDNLLRKCCYTTLQVVISISLILFGIIICILAETALLGWYIADIVMIVTGQLGPYDTNCNYIKIIFLFIKN